MIMLYIDPGTGSMLFALLIGVVSTVTFALRSLIISLKFHLSGGKADKNALSDSGTPFVIFSDQKHYANTFRPILREFEKRKLHAVYWTASNEDPLLHEEFEYVECAFIGEGNAAFVKLNLMKADVCLATTPDLDVTQWKRSRDVAYYVFLMHNIDSALMYRMFGLDYYDALLLSGPVQEEEIRTLEKQRDLPPKELMITGCAYLDALYERALKEGISESHGKTCVLLAPSWGESSLLRIYGERLLQLLADTGFDLIIRPHPQSVIVEKELLDSLQKKFPESDRISWDLSPDNFASLRRSDIMISDFSGVMFDYALVFDKPFLYTEDVFDPSVFDAAWSEKPLWKYEILPHMGKVLKESDFPNLKSILQDCILSSEFAEGRKRAKEDAWQQIGNCASLTVDFLVEKQKAVSVAGGAL